MLQTGLNRLGLVAIQIATGNKMTPTDAGIIQF
jgi:hypothetical protein